jgi:hypothetical protein
MQLRSFTANAVQLYAHQSLKLTGSPTFLTHSMRQ